MVCMVPGVCFMQGWDVGTLGNTLSGCVTQDPSVGPSTPPTLFVSLRARVSPGVARVGWYTNIHK